MNDTGIDGIDELLQEHADISRAALGATTEDEYMDVLRGAGSLGAGMAAIGQEEH